MMRQFLSLVLAGVLGGAIVFVGIQLAQPNSKTTATSQFTSLQNQAANIPLNANFNFVEAAKVVTPSVVNVEAKQTKIPAKDEYKRPSSPFDFFFGGTLDDYFNVPKQGTGSGVIYTNDGYIVTNNHVVEFADEITVTLYDNRTFKAQKVGTYPEADLAVLKIEATGLPTLGFANSDNAQVGEWVLAVGNPFNLVSTVTAGIISAKGRDINAIQDNNNITAIESFIQTDAAVNPGNSGGALVDAQGRLLGINTAIATQTGTFAGYSFAIPINLVKRIADDIIEYGTYERAMLGVSIFPLDKEYVDKNNLNFSQGLVVQEVVDGGSAQYAGILPQDIIVAVNEKPVTSFPELQESISTAKINDEIVVKVYRSGAFENIKVKMKPQRK